ncbi:MAG: L-threonylcarbamoyladenylate synthase [Bacteroidota bacterium]
MTRIVEATSDGALLQAAEAIRKGGTIVYPTDTLYGIGADALNPGAVRKVSLAKRRTEAKPILLLIPNLDVLNSLVRDIPASAQLLMKEFWPGPLTLVFNALPHVPEELTRGTGTVGVRLPANPLCIKLLELCGCPLTSSSANITGQPVHTTVGDIQGQLGDSIDLYLDAGMLQARVPSTVLDVSREAVTLVREGAISREQIQKFIPLS